MAVADSNGVITHARTPRPSARSHYASMRCAENVARSISVRRSVGSIPAAELDAARARQADYYRLAAAYRAAAHRLERGERLRVRVEMFLRPVVRGVRAVRSVVAR